ncbi:MAG: hypothetical protein JWQ39_2883 [Glaciihabitans sp.]|nr:hypothetical protein [Glaciihabitans sp.]
MENDLPDGTPSILPMWRTALSDEAAFSKAVTEQVTLKGSVIAAPISGRANVWTAIRTAGDFTEKLTFIHESTTTERSYLEWELATLGQHFEGVTVLSFDSSGLIRGVAFHHRPLGGVLAVSAEMGRRLGNSLGADMFFQPHERT